MKRSKHNLSHYRITTLNQGQLVPVGLVEVLPGDSFFHSSSVLLRVNTLVKPVMHPVDVRVHHFFVPNRLTWSDWDDFITGAAATTFPVINYTAGSYTDLINYLGLSNDTADFNALPFRAYNKVYNDFYRDQDLTSAVSLDSTAIQKVGWEKDYFSVARTNAQMGASSVAVPVKGISKVTQSFTAGVGPYWESDGTTPTYAQGRLIDGTSGVGNTEFAVEGTAATGIPKIRIELDQFRQYAAMQRFLQIRNRFGKRYVDYLRYLGIKPRDGRIDQPEYLGGGRQTIAFSEVLSTSGGTGGEAVGTMRGHGIAALRTRPYKRFFEESGYVISLLSVRPRAAYYRCMERTWLRRTKEDYWQKEYEAFGPQAVLKREVSQAHGNATDIFGYVGRHDEYRHQLNLITGDFRNAANDEWHFGKTYGSNPTLNTSFIECVPADNAFADTNAVELYAQVAHRLSARRLVSKHPRF